MKTSVRASRTSSLAETHIKKQDQRQQLINHYLKALSPQADKTPLDELKTSSMQSMLHQQQSRKRQFQQHLDDRSRRHRFVGFNTSEQAVNQLIDMLHMFCLRFNHTAPRELYVTCTFPAYCTEDMEYGRTRKQITYYRARLSTSFWSLVARCHDSLIEFFLLPAGLTLGFSKQESLQQPVMQLRVKMLNNKIHVVRGSTEIAISNANGICRELFSLLISKSREEGSTQATLPAASVNCSVTDGSGQMQSQVHQSRTFDQHQRAAQLEQVCLGPGAGDRRMTNTAPAPFLPPPSQPESFRFREHRAFLEYDAKFSMPAAPALNYESQPVRSAKSISVKTACAAIGQTPVETINAVGEALATIAHGFSISSSGSGPAETVKIASGQIVTAVSALLPCVSNVAAAPAEPPADTSVAGQVKSLLQRMESVLTQAAQPAEQRIDAAAHRPPALNQCRQSPGDSPAADKSAVTNSHELVDNCESTTQLPAGSNNSDKACAGSPVAIDGTREAEIQSPAAFDKSDKSAAAADCPKIASRKRRVNRETAKMLKTTHKGRTKKDERVMTISAAGPTRAESERERALNSALSKLMHCSSNGVTNKQQVGATAILVSLLPNAASKNEQSLREAGAQSMPERKCVNYGFVESIQHAESLSPQKSLPSCSTPRPMLKVAGTVEMQPAPDIRRFTSVPLAASQAAPVDSGAASRSAAHTTADLSVVVESLPKHPPDSVHIGSKPSSGDHVERRGAQTTVDKESWPDGLEQQQQEQDADNIVGGSPEYSWAQGRQLMQRITRGLNQHINKVESEIETCVSRARQAFLLRKFVEVEQANSQAFELKKKISGLQSLRTQWTTLLAQPETAPQGEYDDTVGDIVSSMNGLLYLVKNQGRKCFIEGDFEAARQYARISDKLQELHQQFIVELLSGLGK